MWIQKTLDNFPLKITKELIYLTISDSWQFKIEVVKNLTDHVKKFSKIVICK